MSARFGGVGAWRVRSNSAVFYAAEIAAAKMLLFFRGSAAMDILTLRGTWYQKLNKAPFNPPD